MDLALEKQRLQIEVAMQRAALRTHVDGLRPLLRTVDQVGEGVRWVRRHPEALAGGILVLAAVRPGMRRFLWRWGGRGYFAWRMWRDSHPGQGQPRPAHG
ncbi:MAG: YqjK-like family protein [Pseudomonadota bacterium]